MTEIYIILLLIILILVVLMVLILSQKKNLTQAIQTKLDQDNQENKILTYKQNIEMLEGFDKKVHEMIERNLSFERETTKNFQDFYQNLTRSLGESFDKQHQVLETRLNKIDTKVNESLEEGFEKTQKTFTNIVERLSKIDEAQKKIEALSTDIGDLQSVLTDKSARGAFGEVNLNQILKAVFGDKNDRIFRIQHQFSTGVRADAVLFTPEPLGTIAIDAKFPLENYQKMVSFPLNSLESSNYEKIFKADVRKHIDDISNKYIIHEETSDQALMFLPAEAIFAYINAYHPDLIAYSQKKRVWITSPTTLMSTLTTIQTIMTNMERDKYAKEIQNELIKLKLEFDRYRDRWDKLSGSIDRVSKEIKDINVTTQKITNRFDAISNVEYKGIEEIESE